MTGATITPTEIVPNAGMKVIFFTVTLDGSAKASFADYERVEWINAQDVTSGVDEAVTANTAGGDVTFTNNDNVIRGMAVVVVASS